MSKEQKTNDSEALLPRLTLAIARLAEVVHWGLAAAMLVGTLVTVFWPTQIAEWVKTSILNGGTNLSCYGYEVVVASTEGTLNPGMVLCFTIGSAVVLALMAMIFRNVYLILKTAKGKTWFAKGDTPFQKDIVRMFREIGIFFIAISIMSLISEVIVNIVGGELAAGFNYMSCFIGLVFLCISQFFNYGTRLEKDLDGLV